MKNKRVFFTGGGTAGHVYPALAILEELVSINKDLKFYWIGRKNSFEEDLIKNSSLGKQITFLPISSGKYRRYFSFQNFIDIFKIIFGFFQSLFYMIKYRPAFTFSKGGFVSVPAVIASWFAFIPVISHESDLDPGLATKINAPLSKMIFISWEGSQKYFRNSQKVKLMGNPVRREILNVKEEDRKSFLEKYNIPEGMPIILAMGGSLGAEQINKNMDNIKEELSQKAFIIHQTGKIREASSSHNYISLPFLNLAEISVVFSLATIVVSRSGAGSLSEMAVLRKAMVLIPLERGSRGDQLRNALYFEKKEAAIVLKGNFTSQDLLSTLTTLLDNPQKREALQLNTKVLSFPKAALNCAKMLNDTFLN